MERIPRWAAVLIGAIVFFLFLVANRGAYEGYFHGDDLDNVAWVPQTQAKTFLTELISPVFSRNNFRPAGHFFFWLLEPLAGLRFPVYVAVLQILHLGNAVLLGLIARRAGSGLLPAAIASLFFVFHAATFDAYWRPMYVFDLLCTLFSLLCVLSYLSERWILSFLCFWLAYKSKELAVMLPAVLAVYEFWLGRKRWKPLVPFLLVSLSFGVQALLANKGSNDAYTIRLSSASLAETLRFYAIHVMVFPLAGAALLAAAVFLRDRRLHFALAAAALLCLPLLLLPDRVFSVYLYLPLTFIAVAVAVLAERQPLAAVVALAAVWFPLMYSQLRNYRRDVLTAASENREYVETLRRWLPTSFGVKSFVFDGAPRDMHEWGIRGVLRYLTGNPRIRLAAADGESAQELYHETNLAVLSWDAARRQLKILGRGPATSYIKVDPAMPLWQFGEGWYAREGRYRWARPRAGATLLRPRNASQFEVSINVNPGHLKIVGRIELAVLIDGEALGMQSVSAPGWQSLRWKIRPAAPGIVALELISGRPYRPPNDPRLLGVAVGGLGFIE